MAKKKKGRYKLTEMDKFYIDNHPEKSLSELAKTLGMSPSGVSKYLSRNHGAKTAEERAVKRGDLSYEETKNAEGETVTRVVPGPALELFGRKRRGDTNEGSAIVMTQAASEHGDEIEKLEAGKVNNPPHVYKIHPNL